MKIEVAFSCLFHLTNNTISSFYLYRVVTWCWLLYLLSLERIAMFTWSPSQQQLKGFFIYYFCIIVWSFFIIYILTYFNSLIMVFVRLRHTIVYNYIRYLWNCIKIFDFFFFFKIGPSYQRIERVSKSKYWSSLPQCQW